MSILNLVYKNIEKKNIDVLVEKVIPILKNGMIILSNQKNALLYILSPTTIRHCSFVAKNSDAISVIGITESGFSEMSIYEYISLKDDFYVLEYRDEKIMTRTVELIYGYRDYDYGFFRDGKYCFQILKRYILN